MKRAVILHGTDGNPEENWQPWLKGQLEARGYDVFVPQLPGSHTPDWRAYELFLRESGWDFSECLLFGHSAGSSTILRMLESDWMPKVKAAVFVGLFVNTRTLDALAVQPEWYVPHQFDNLFSEDGFDYRTIMDKAEKRYVIHGSDDPYCSLADAETAANLMQAKLIVVEGGKHLSKGSGNISELPWAIEALERDGVL